MSKAVPVVTLGAIAAATAGLAAVGIGAFLLAQMAWNKGKALTAALSPEERTYLLPFSADYDRQKLEAAMIPYQPLEGIEFGEALPTFGVSSRENLSFPLAEHGSQLALPAPPHQEIFAGFGDAAQAVGFAVEPRMLPAGASVFVFDLVQTQELRETVPWQPVRRFS